MEQPSPMPGKVPSAARRKRLETAAAELLQPANRISRTPSSPLPKGGCHEVTGGFVFAAAESVALPQSICTKQVGTPILYILPLQILSDYVIMIS